MARVLSRHELKESFEKASPRLQLASVVAEFAEILRQSSHAKEHTMEDVYGEAVRLAKVLDGQEDVKEFVTLVEAAEKLLRNK